MTLLEFLKKAQDTGDFFNTYDIPVKLKGRNIHDIVFEIAEDDNDEYYINVKLR